MPYIQSKGSPSSQVWVLVDTPLKNDSDKGFVFSSGIGYMFHLMMQDAGFSDYYVTAYRPNTDALDSFQNVEGALNQWQPPIIIPLGDCGQHLCKELRIQTKTKPFDVLGESKIEKYAGSILVSDDLTYPHYIVPTIAPAEVVKQWKLRDIVVSCDLMKAYSELEYFNKHNSLQPLPEREFKINLSTDEIIYELERMPSICPNSVSGFPLISNDIETIYPREKSKFKGKHPGEILTIGLAPSTSFGLSFELWRENPKHTVHLWKSLQSLLNQTAQLGQNFINFDLNFYKMYGFEMREDLIQDTLIKHHILWPELPHRLGFLSRQYTREKFHKDDGHQWSIKDMTGLKRYNALDCMITLECWEEMEKELDQRPHLR